MTTPSDKQTDNQPALQPPELLPCWCREETKWLCVKPNIDHGDFACKERGYYVFCSNCWAHGPTSLTGQGAREGWNKSRARVDGGVATVDVAHCCTNGSYRPYPTVLCSSCRYVVHNLSIRELCERLNAATAPIAAEGSET